MDDAGFDGAVVLRYAGRRVEQTYVPPTPAPLWGYYGYGWGTAYNPAYVRQNELVDIDTTVYSVKDRELLWAGRTESMDPHDVRRTVDEIAVAAAMRNEGVDSARVTVRVAAAECSTVGGGYGQVEIPKGAPLLNQSPPTPSREMADLEKFSLRSQVSPTGFEPVLPA